MSSVLDFEATLKSPSANAWAHGGKAGGSGNGRMRHRMAVRVSLPDDPSYNTCETLEIGRTGAVLLVPRRVDGLSSLLLINPRTSRQVACRIVDARPQSGGRTCVEVEFLADTPNFWGVTIASASRRSEQHGAAREGKAAPSMWSGSIVPTLVLSVVMGVAMFLLVLRFEGHRGSAGEQVMQFLKHPTGVSLTKSSGQ